MSAVAMLATSALYRLGQAMLGRRDDEAFRLASRLALAGNRKAMTILGTMYLLGRGCQADAVEGAAWLTQATGGCLEGEAAELLAIWQPQLSQDQQAAIHARRCDLLLKIQSRHFAILSVGVP
ncbi:hypothetical protein [Paramagnetospirillum magneticum]|uniref:hypothetical protein n=1 Tax=Paramagnetospirillum magneticum TaxID=84159 RepID=UPI0005C20F10|nr:hypothetical protein [Paramagnetospirillum magneticum]